MGLPKAGGIGAAFSFGQTGTKPMETTSYQRIARRQFGYVAGTGLATAVGGWLGCGRHEGRNERRTLYVFNWSDYIDDDALAQFEKKFSCAVVYDNYSSDSELETRLATAAGSYDVV